MRKPLRPLLSEPTPAGAATYCGMTAQCARQLGVARDSMVSIRVVQGLIEIVEMSGVARSQFLRAARVSPDALDAGDARIPRSEMYRLVEVAVELTGDPGLGLHWGERLSANTFT